MGIGVGVFLTLLGLILLFRVVNVDIPWVDDYALGALLTLVGVVSVILVMIMGAMRRRSTHVIERNP